MTTNGLIFVTGAPGNIGTEVVKGLVNANVRFRVGARDLDSARKTLSGVQDIVPFDFLNPSTFSAFEGAETLFLVRPPALANVQKEIAPALNAAKAAGVKRIVFLSIQGVEQNKRVPHYKIEQYIRSIGLDFTFLRASFFMQNLSTTHRAEIQQQNKIALPVGKSKTSFIDARDIGAVAARVLTEPGHVNRMYTLTGPEALDYYQVAQILTEVLGRPIRYTNPMIPAFVISQLRMNQKPGMVLVMTMLYTITRFGNAAEVTPDTEQILQRPPITFRQFATDFCHVWDPVVTA